MRASVVLMVSLLLVVGSNAVAVDDTWDTFTPVDTFVAVPDTDPGDTDDSDKVEETDAPSETDDSEWADDSDWASETDSDGGSDTDSDAADTAYAGGALASALTGERGGPACAVGARSGSGALLLLVFGALLARRRGHA